MLVRELRPRPRLLVRIHRGIAPACRCRSTLWNGYSQWFAYYLSRWALLEVLEYLSVLSVLFGVIFYFSESGDRESRSTIRHGR